MNSNSTNIRLSLLHVLCLGIVARGDLVNRYSFTNGDTAAVDSISGNDGTLEAGATIIGNQVILDGLDDFVDLPAETIAINAYSELTLELWTTKSVDVGYSMTAAFGDTWPPGDGGTGRDYIFIATGRGDDQNRGAIANTDDYDQPWLDEVGVSGPAEFNDGEEHHFALTITATELKWYVDGEQVGDTQDMGNTTIEETNNTYAYLGRSVYLGDVTMNCSINEFRIYDTALSAEEVQASYNAGPDVISVLPIVIEESDDSTEIIEGSAVPDTYTIRLAWEPEANVTVTVDPDEQLDIGQGRGNPTDLYFNDQNWSVEQQVSVIAYDDDIREADPHNGWIAHTIASSDPNFNDIPLPYVVASISENECGAWGYNYSDLSYDCWVNMKDYAIFAGLWPSPLNPITLNMLVAEWLSTTQPYAPGAAAGPVQDAVEEIEIDPATVIGSIDEKVYGHFLEHIYHSVNGGLWGELVWNRSFELPGIVWSIEGDELVQSSLATDVHMEFGDTAWEDYEINLEACKDGGSEAFLILFRAPDSDNFYWCNIGGWGNTQHAIEKEVNGGRGVVTSYVSGSINTDQWYDIRIRCEGNNFQVWLDGSPLFDYTDTDNPHLTGEMGVGTWATQARYRNIEVTEIPGSEVLFSGLPSIPENEFDADFWTVFGTGEATMDSDALNDDLSVQIVTTGGGTGLQQDDFKFTQQAYHGSLWMKGSMPAGLSVELLDGETVLGQAALPEPNSTWTEYSFQITPTASTDDGSLRITLQGAGTINIDQVSMMGQDAIDIGGYRPDLYQAVADLEPPVIRWPGGYFAELYRWKAGIGSQHERVKFPIVAWDDQDVNSYGTDEFVPMCHAISAEPIIVINIGSHDSINNRPEYIQDANDWVEYCNGPASSPWGAVRAANGHPDPYNVKYWEIDNEVWFQMDTNTYIQALQQFVPVLKAKDPSIKIIACGSGSFNSDWDYPIIDACADIIDYISIHHYEGTGGYQTGPLNFEAYIDQLGAYIAGSSNPDIKIYASEWNLQSTDWRTGLYAGGLLNGFERQNDVFEIGGPALFLRHQSASDWDNAFINFDHTGWFPAPNYVVMKLWHDNYASNQVPLTGSLGNLNAVATKTADGNTLYFKVVNPTDQNTPVKLVIEDNFDPGNASLQLVAPGSLYARNTLSSPDTVKAENAYVIVTGQIIRFTMPSLSAGVVKIERDN